ncbi:MAG: T9SS type A sorting domain-containing protein, partial [Chitinophagales bacterium]|nr:T9SS type A sorting domain-containing protein [Chitinophagales bacterium]
WLYVGGDFYYAGDKVSRMMGIWNGTSWISTEKPNAYLGSPVAALLAKHDTIYYATGGIVAAMKENTYIEGTGLPGLGDEVLCMQFYHDTLYAGGNFGGYLKKWTGRKWETLGGGLSALTPGHVDALCVYNDQLIAGGLFKYADGKEVNNIAAWDGKVWQGFGSGTAIAGTIYSGNVLALTVYGDDLITGGFFNMAGGDTADGIARWSEGKWNAMPGLCGQVNYLITKGKGFYACGDFGESGDGKCIANRITFWNGDTWVNLGFTIYDSGPLCMSFFNDELIAGGYFETIANNPINRIAMLANFTGFTDIKNKKQISIFPNPATDQLHIEAPNIHNATVTILNLFGQVMLKQEFSNNASIDISTLSKGMYLVNIIDEKGNVLKTGKVVRE